MPWTETVTMKRLEFIHAVRPAGILFPLSAGIFVSAVKRVTSGLSVFSPMTSPLLRTIPVHL